MTAAGGRRHSRGRDIAWSVLIVAMALYALGSVVGVAVNAARGDWFETVLSVLWLPFSYWMAVGAWRRTSWAAR